ncbi:MAG TPA: four helix bundle protein [Blastocatellia bacterium]|nr:four helix bundle protein [Blastocatellia bacterium]
MEVRSFRDLRVWQAAMDLVEMVYKASVDFPKHETYGLTSQIPAALERVLELSIRCARFAVGVADSDRDREET